MITFGKPKDIASVAESPVAKAVEPIAKEPAAKNRDAFFSIVLIALGVMLGVLLVNGPAMFKSDDKKGDDSIVIDDDKKDEGKKQDGDGMSDVEKGTVLVLVAERGDGIDPVVMDFKDKLDAYAAEKGIATRWYDPEMEAAKVFVDYAASRNMTPPFLASFRSGKVVDVRKVDSKAKESGE